MGTHWPFYIWLYQSVPALVVYPPFDVPNILVCRGTCHDRTQFLREPCQVVKQNLSLFIHDIFHESFHPGLMRPVNVSIREGSFGLIMLFFIRQIILFRTDFLLPRHKGRTKCGRMLCPCWSKCCAQVCERHSTESWTRHVVCDAWVPGDRQSVHCTACPGPGTDRTGYQGFHLSCRRWHAKLAT